MASKIVLTGEERGGEDILALLSLKMTGVTFSHDSLAHTSLIASIKEMHKNTQDNLVAQTIFATPDPLGTLSLPSVHAAGRGVEAPSVRLSWINGWVGG